MDQLLQKLGEHVAYIVIVVITFIVIWITEKIKKLLQKRKKKLNDAITSKNIKIYSELDEILTEFRVLSDCARISILQFHNGEYFYNGSPILKFSMTHESCARGVSSTIQKIQGYYLSPYYKLIELAQKEFTVISVENMEDLNLKGFFHANNTISFILLPIKCGKNVNMIGLLLIEWCSEPKSEKINKEEIQKLCGKFLSLIKNILNNKKVEISDETRI